METGTLWTPGPWCWRNGHLSTVHGGGKVVLMACAAPPDGYGSRSHFKTRDPQTGVLVPLDENSRLALMLAALPEITERLHEAVDALEWCSGASAFQEGGEAHDGWKHVAAPALFDARSLLTRLTEGEGD